MKYCPFIYRANQGYSAKVFNHSECLGDKCQLWIKKGTYEGCGLVVNVILEKYWAMADALANLDKEGTGVEK